MQLHHIRTNILKVQRYRLKNIPAGFFPSFDFCEDGVAKRTSTIAPFLSVPNLKD